LEIAEKTAGKNTEKALRKQGIGVYFFYLVNAVKLA
jgi:hypothetical protein